MSPLSDAAMEQLQAEAWEDARLLVESETSPLWRPDPENKPQQEAYASPADEIFYGGAAGGGKTDLGLGLALTHHRRSIFFRRELGQLRDAIERTAEIVGGRDGLNENLHIWRRLPGNRVLEFGGMEQEADKYKWKGRPHDLYIFDEAADFSESQIDFVTGWLRTTAPGQRTRIVLLSNPPTSSEGEWIIRRFAPWLGPEHPNPAQPGELRWFARLDDKWVEVADSSPIAHNGEAVRPRSRTFIPAKWSDNPHLAPEYLAVLQALPEPLKSQLLKGLFSLKHDDHAWQVIPSAWVQAAQKRWLETPKPDLVLRLIGEDVARGGADRTVLAPLYGTWFAPLVVFEGHETPDGPTAALKAKEILDEERARLVAKAAAEGRPAEDVKIEAPIFVDVIGVGSSCFDTLISWSLSAVPINFGAGSDATDLSGKFGFANIRAEAYWKLREALDPTSGEDICLPPGREILADLCAPRFKAPGGKIQIEPKDDIKKRLGRSPDSGDAIALAWFGVSGYRWHGGIFA